MVQRKMTDPLEVRFDPEVSAEVRRELIDSLARGNADIEQAVEYELGDRDVVEDFEQAMAPLGLNARFLADIMCGYYIVMWMIVHRESLPSRGRATALKQQLTRQLLANPIVFDAKKRQLSGEAMIYETLLALETYRKAQDSADEVQLKRLARNGQKNMLGRGVDLRKMRITNAGLQPR